MKLHPFQRNAVDWMKLRVRAYLAAKMGLGKSVIAITALGELDAFPCVIVCPKIVKAHWFAEIKKWLPNRASEFEVVSYEEAVKLANNKESGPYAAVVFDESHYLKTPTAQRTKRLLLDKNSLISKSKRVYFLSGTPAQNNVSELWAPFFAMGAVKERFYAFTERYCEFRQVWIATPHGRKAIQKISGSIKAKMPELKARLKDFIFQVSYAEARIQLPSVLFSNLSVDALRSSDDHRLEKEMESQFAAHMRGNTVDPLVALQAFETSLSSLRKAHALRKVRACLDLVELELEMGLYSKVVIFAHHQQVLEDLHAGFNARKVSSVFVHGAVEAGLRYERVERFQSDGSLCVFLASIQATGVGINLHSASHILFIEQTYVPADTHQAIARCARIGQKEDAVYVRWLTLSDSGIDQRVNDILMKKTLDLKEILD